MFLYLKKNEIFDIKKFNWFIDIQKSIFWYQEIMRRRFTISWYQ